MEKETQISALVSAGDQGAARAPRPRDRREEGASRRAGTPASPAGPAGVARRRDRPSEARRHPEVRRSDLEGDREGEADQGLARPSPRWRLGRSTKATTGRSFGRATPTSIGSSTSSRVRTSSSTTWASRTLQWRRGASSDSPRSRPATSRSTVCPPRCGRSCRDTRCPCSGSRVSPSMKRHAVRGSASSYSGSYSSSLSGWRATLAASASRLTQNRTRSTSTGSTDSSRSTWPRDSPMLALRRSRCSWRPGRFKSRSTGAEA